MDIERAREYCLYKTGVTEDQAFGPEHILFRVGNKIFAVIDLERPNLITLKCQPDLCSSLKEKYQGISGAWHWNKKHWIDVRFEVDVEDRMVLSLIDHSYDEVIKKLPQKRLYRILNLPKEWVHEHHPLCDSAMSIARQEKFADITREAVLITTDFQTAGRGQGKNVWESEKEKNLLFAIRIKPSFLEAKEQFLLSQCIAMTLVATVKKYVSKKICIKWPNDIYVGDRKICGILIENTLNGTKINDSIIGVGLNVNQKDFPGNVPNPISIRMINDKEVDRAAVLRAFIKNLEKNIEKLRKAPHSFEFDYLRKQYRIEGVHWFRDKTGPFQASLHAIYPNGQLELIDTQNKIRRYYHKEVEYVISK